LQEKKDFLPPPFRAILKALLDQTGRGPILQVNKASGDDTHEAMTPLMWAASEGREDLVADLLNAGADATSTAIVGGKCALELACERGHETLVTRMVQVGARHIMGNVALQARCLFSAIQQGNDRLFVKLRDGFGFAMQGARNTLGETHLVAAIRCKAHAIVCKCIEERGDAVDTCITLDEPHPVYALKELSALIAATLNQQFSIMTLLLEGERPAANVNLALPASGNTALSLAVERGLVDAVRFLVTYNANPIITRTDGETPVSLAVAMGNVTMLEVLLL